MSESETRASLPATPDANNLEASLAPPSGDQYTFAIVQRSGLGIILTDAAQRIIYVNPAFVAITGYSVAEIVGQTPRLLRSGRQGEDFYSEMQQSLIEKGAWRGELWNRKKDGTLYLQWLDLHVWRDSSGAVTNFLGVFSPIERYQAPQERLRFLALHDSVTGLANRLQLQDRAELALASAGRNAGTLALLCIDLDRFQSINNDYGSAAGDAVLREVGQRLSRVLRRNDTLARVGADEFVCLLPEVAAREDALRVANNLQAALAPPLLIDGTAVRVVASMGLATWPDDATDFDALLQLAQQAMRSAKDAGGNLVRCFCPQMAVTAGRQLELEEHLSAAIDAGELELHYQPKIELRSGRVVGVEALVRWRDPQLGLIPPGDFIPLAQKSDLIVRIDSWVLRAACAALGRWERAGRLPEGFRVAINISAKQFERCDLLQDIEAALASAGLAASRLQVEVTESLLIKNPSQVATTLRSLAERGVSVALDDFGTAYSNLLSLARLPLDTIKLDQSFVRGVDSNPVHATITRAVWHLGDGLGKDMVAEGIENCAECSALMALGYRYGQGYRFARPMDEARLLDLCAAWQLEPCCPCPEDPPAGASLAQ